jgi:hypothetical protein
LPDAPTLVLEQFHLQLSDELVTALKDGSADLSEPPIKGSVKMTPSHETTTVRNSSQVQIIKLNL